MRERKARNRNIQKKRKKGFTYQAIGTGFHLSRQRIFQICNKKHQNRVWRWLKGFIESYVNYYGVRK